MGQHVKWISFRFPRIVLLIGIEKTAGAALAALGAVVAVWIHTHHGVDPFNVLLPSLRTSSNHLIHGIDVTIALLAPHALLLAAGLAVWALLMAAESIGIWLHRGWGEGLVIAETALFVLLEVWAIVHKANIGDLVTLTVNGLILLYLVKRYKERRNIHAQFDTRGKMG